MVSGGHPQRRDCGRPGAGGWHGRHNDFWAGPILLRVGEAPCVERSVHEHPIQVFLLHVVRIVEWRDCPTAAELAEDLEVIVYPADVIVRRLERPADLFIHEFQIGLLLVGPILVFRLSADSQHTEVRSEVPQSCLGTEGVRTQQLHCSLFHLNKFGAAMHTPELDGGRVGLLLHVRTLWRLQCRRRGVWRLGTIRHGELRRSDLHIAAAAGASMVILHIVRARHARRADGAGPDAGVVSCGKGRDVQDPGAIAVEPQRRNHWWRWALSLGIHHWGRRHRGGVAPTRPEPHVQLGQQRRSLRQIRELDLFEAEAVDEVQQRGALEARLQQRRQERSAVWGRASPRKLPLHDLLQGGPHSFLCRPWRLRGRGGGNSCRAPCCRGRDGGSNMGLLSWPRHFDEAQVRPMPVGLHEGDLEASVRSLPLVFQACKVRVQKPVVTRGTIAPVRSEVRVHHDEGRLRGFPHRHPWTRPRQQVADDVLLDLEERRLHRWHSLGVRDVGQLCNELDGPRGKPMQRRVHEKTGQRVRLAALRSSISHHCARIAIEAAGHCRSDYVKHFILLGCAART
mmetsp:Transcript_64803/g.180365  ORF Transcript_64803/g.180365 Transcript_64803/m.180365 type:complete len:568 (-) Transcript_64803:309-2012(-)